MTEDRRTHNEIRDSLIIGNVFQARDVTGSVTPGPPAAGPGSSGATGSQPSAPTDPWPRQAATSPLWPPHTPLPLRKATTQAAARLAQLRDLAEPHLRTDPWQDPGLPARCTARTEWLTADLALSPPEAALLILLPYLHQVRRLHLAATLAHLDPATLRRHPAPDADRAAFEAFIEGHDLLRHRARLRPDTEPSIGWWLFHRWLAERDLHTAPDQITALVTELGIPALSELLHPDRMGLLLHGITRGPAACDPDFLSQLQPEDHLSDHQPLREQRLLLLAALAHATAIEITALPDVVAEHLGIPNAVDPAELRDTLDGARWGGSRELPVLRADCRHEAVIEGLREHTAGVDDLLHRIHRVVRERITVPMPELPTRFSADGLTGPLTGYARFRQDDAGVRHLLGGVQLYKDPGLAVRELYQNGLDGLRYRAARTEYLTRTGVPVLPFEPALSIVQEVDEDGREYLECAENGIGMGEKELRGVFCTATARFTQQVDYRRERADWLRLDPPVRLYPNSRFGIGVFSYFMLAEEIRVTTCRMEPDGRPGPVLEARIYGPGNLFRIVRLAERGAEPGTKVRLYLRGREELDRYWSALEVLDRVLAIAEFPTTARHGSRQLTWTAGELRAREATEGHDHQYHAGGALCPAPVTPSGSRVIWCAEGGGVLVDGLAVGPQPGALVHRAGVVGAVVNLCGELAPRLSYDRTSLIEDVTGVLDELLADAVPVLTAPDCPLPEFWWLARIAVHSPRRADAIVAACARAERPLPLRDRPFAMARTGFFLADDEILRKTDVPVRQRIDQPSTEGHLPDHVLLWRLLADAPNPVLTSLTEACPELAEVTAVRPALPSDVLALAPTGQWLSHWSQAHPAFRYPKLEEVGFTPEELARRAAELGVDLSVPSPVTVNLLRRTAHRWDLDLEDLAVIWRDRGIEVPAEVLELALAAEEHRFLLPNLDPAMHDCLDPAEEVPAGHLAQASLALGLPVSAVCEAFERLGYQVHRTGLPESPDELTATLLSQNENGGWPWLRRSEPVPPGRVLELATALEASPAEAVNWLSRFGFTASLPADAHVDEWTLLYNDIHHELLRPPGPVPLGHLLTAAGSDVGELAGIVARLRDYGFNLPFTPPERPDKLDGFLLYEEGPLHHWWIGAGEEAPFASVLVAAEEVRLQPRQLIARLRKYGIQVAAHRLPAGLSADWAEDLLRRAVNTGLSLSGLLDIARWMGRPIPRIVTWLQVLGVEVPDLGETLRDTLARVPR